MTTQKKTKFAVDHPRGRIQNCLMALGKTINKQPNNCKIISNLFTTTDNFIKENFMLIIKSLIF